MADLFATEVARLELARKQLDVEAEIEETRLRLFELERERFAHLLNTCASNTDCIYESFSTASTLHREAVEHVQDSEGAVAAALAASNSTETSYLSIADQVHKARKYIVADTFARLRLASKAQRAALAAVRHEAAALAEAETAQALEAIHESTSTHIVQDEQAIQQRHRRRSLVQNIRQQEVQASIKAAATRQAANLERVAVDDRVDRARAIRAKKIAERRRQSAKAHEALRRVVVAVIRRSRAVRARVQDSRLSLQRHQYAARMELVVQGRAAGAGLAAVKDSALARVQAAARVRAREKRAQHIRGRRLEAASAYVDEGDAEEDIAIAGGGGAADETASAATRRAYLAAASSVRFASLRTLTTSTQSAEVDAAVRQRRLRRQRRDAQKAAAAAAEAGRKANLRREIVLGILRIGRRAVASVAGVRENFEVVERKFGLTLRQAFYESEDELVGRDLLRAKDLMEQQRTLAARVQQKVLMPTMRDVRDAVRQVRGSNVPTAPEGLSAVDSMASWSETRSVGPDFGHVVADIFGVRLPSFSAGAGGLGTWGPADFAGMSPMGGVGGARGGARMLLSPSSPGGRASPAGYPPMYLEPPTTRVGGGRGGMSPAGSPVNAIAGVHGYTPILSPSSGVQFTASPNVAKGVAQQSPDATTLVDLVAAGGSGAADRYISPTVGVTGGRSGVFGTSSGGGRRVESVGEGDGRSPLMARRKAAKGGRGGVTVSPLHLSVDGGGGGGGGVLSDGSGSRRVVGSAASPALSRRDVMSVGTATSGEGRLGPGGGAYASAYPPGGARGGAPWGGALSAATHSLDGASMASRMRGGGASVTGGAMYRVVGASERQVTAAQVAEARLQRALMRKRMKRGMDGRSDDVTSVAPSHLAPSGLTGPGSTRRGGPADVGDSMSPLAGLGMRAVESTRYPDDEDEKAGGET